MPGRTPIRQNARIEHDEALKRVMTAVLNDDMQLFKQFEDNEGFRRWLTDNVFGLTYAPAAGQQPDGGPGLTALLPTAALWSSFAPPFSGVQEKVKWGLFRSVEDYSIRNIV